MCFTEKPLIPTKAGTQFLERPAIMHVIGAQAFAGVSGRRA